MGAPGVGLDDAAVPQPAVGRSGVGLSPVAHRRAVPGEVRVHVGVPAGHGASYRTTQTVLKRLHAHRVGEGQPEGVAFNTSLTRP
jgi:hypothetical protein